jgi:FkbM family methyltransferase
MRPDLPSANTAPFGACLPSPIQRRIIDFAHRTPFKRGTFRPMLSRLVSLLGAGPVDTKYQGASFRLYHHESGTEKGALFNPGYNLEELAFLRKQTPTGGVFVDIGANVGTIALPLAYHVGPQGRVVAIEAHPVAHSRIAFNTAASRLDNVTIVEAAAADVDGELTIVSGDNLGASHIATDKDTSGFRVRARTLAGLLADAAVERVDALKIDVEGYEDRVLIEFFRNSPQTLWPTAVVIEHLSRSQWRDDCLADMQDRGYVVVARTRSNTLLLRSA